MRAPAATPAMPIPSFVEAAAIPATCVPWPFTPSSCGCMAGVMKFFPGSSTGARSAFVRSTPVSTMAIVTGVAGVGQSHHGRTFIESSHHWVESMGSFGTPAARRTRTGSATANSGSRPRRSIAASRPTAEPVSTTRVRMASMRVTTVSPSAARSAVACAAVTPGASVSTTRRAARATAEDGASPATLSAPCSSGTSPPPVWPGTSKVAGPPAATGESGDASATPRRIVAAASLGRCRPPLT